MMKKVFYIFLFLCAIFIPTQNANAVSIQDQLNNYETPRKTYESNLSPAYLRNNVSDENINPQSGSLTISQTDYSLPGKNGLNVEIKRIMSGNAQPYRIYTLIDTYSGDYIDYADTKTSESFYEQRYNLGVGTRFSFPSIEMIANSSSSPAYYRYLHTDSGVVYNLSEPVGGIYGLMGHTAQDLIVKDDISYRNPDSVASQFVMVEKNGKKTYFDNQGRILGIKDRYGNEIKFQYSNISYTVNGNTITKTLINFITDTMGRKFKIEYKQDPNARATSNSSNPATNIYPYIQDSFDVIIYLPDNTPIDWTDNKRITYRMGAFACNPNTMQVSRKMIQGVIDFDSKWKYWYERGLNAFNFTYMGHTKYAPELTLYYSDITAIDYEKSNKKTIFNYGLFTKAIGDSGSILYYKVVEKIDAQKDADDANYNSLSGPNMSAYTLKASTKYSYINEPDGYGVSGYLKNDINYLKNTYRYSAEITNPTGAKTKYTYDGIGNLVTDESYGNDHRNVITRTFDTNMLPAKITTVGYNVVNDVSGVATTKIENYQYDGYGNLLQYTGPEAQRDANGNPLNTENTVFYTYTTNCYNILTSKSWKENASTTSRIDYTVDTYGNVTQEKKTHFENAVDKSIITSYIYDSFGNMIQKTINSPDNTYVTKYIYGTDADGTDCSGAYLTREYGTKDSVDYSVKYVYDFYNGLVKAKIDERGNRTNYQYDTVYRLLKTTYPDSKIESFVYTDSITANREIQKTDKAGNIFSSIFDVFGNIINYAVYAGTNRQTLAAYVYDACGNKIVETDGNGNITNYSYDSAGRSISKYVPKNKSYPITDIVINNANINVDSDTLNAKIDTILKAKLKANNIDVNVNTVQGMQSLKATKVNSSTASNTFYALNENGDLYAMGSNNYGLLGADISDENYFAYKPIKILANVKDIKTAGSVAIAIDASGNVYTWGKNTMTDTPTNVNNPLNESYWYVAMLGNGESGLKYQKPTYLTSGISINSPFSDNETYTGGLQSQYNNCFQPWAISTGFDGYSSYNYSEIGFFPHTKTFSYYSSYWPAVYYENDYRALKTMSYTNKNLYSFSTDTCVFLDNGSTYNKGQIYEGNSSGWGYEQIVVSPVIQYLTSYWNQVFYSDSSYISQATNGTCELRMSMYLLELNHNIYTPDAIYWSSPRTYQSITTPNNYTVYNVNDSNNVAYCRNDGYMYTRTSDNYKLSFARYMGIKGSYAGTNMSFSNPPPPDGTVIYAANKGRGSSESSSYNYAVSPYIQSPLSSITDYSTNYVIHWNNWTYAPNWGKYYPNAGKFEDSYAGTLNNIISMTSSCL